MPSAPLGLAQQPEWLALARRRDALARTTLRELFAADPARAERFALEAAGLYLDCSKNKLDDETLALLVRLAEARGLGGAIDAMFRGERINRSEDRSVLHVALRVDDAQPFPALGRDLAPELRAERLRRAAFADALRSGRRLGGAGRPIRNVVNLGIGGSQLGPAFAADALRAQLAPQLRLRFASNLDPLDFERATAGLDPRETLFLVCSKSFRTQETQVNAERARRWCASALGGGAALAGHFAALTGDAAAARAAGIADELVFPIPEWVGGRFSLASAAGLALEIGIGSERFDALRAGFRAMDEHFRSAPFARNLPVLLGLIGIWNTNFQGCESLAVLPYDERLALLPAYLQQLEMESNGKSVDAEGRALDVATAPIVWGGVETGGQHSFHQLLHQGTRRVACDFVAALRGAGDAAGERDLLFANCLAQSRALAFGCSAEELAAAGVAPAAIPARVVPGDRPSNTLLLPDVDPAALGALIALYEHKVFAQGVIWGINSFDQWGVELGKQLATRIAAALAGDPAARSEQDPSTLQLLDRYQRWRDAT